MQNKSNKTARSGIRGDYDFSQGGRGEYARRYSEATNVVVLDPDVAKVFPNSKKVNASFESSFGAKASGMKASGVGREGGDEALHFFTESKNIASRNRLFG